MNRLATPLVRVGRRERLVAAAAAATSVVVIAGLAALLGAANGPPPIQVGAVFPLSSNAGALAKQEELGVAIAADLVNADGGIGGRRIELDVRDLPDAAAAPAVIGGLRAAGAPVVVGAYSSDLSIPASAAANAAGLVYWEAGAVADRLTGRGLPLVFRVGANGARLGTNSAQFAATQLAPRLGLEVARVRVTIVAADDDYANSVADAAAAESRQAGMVVAARIPYNLSYPDWPRVMAALQASRPDVVILASHIPDGEAFRRAMLAAHIHVGALIGSTMAECVPEFGADLGTAALGIFGSDRPPANFNPAALGPAARAVYDRFAAAWRQRTGGTPTEEGVSGFAAAWALFHDVLPAAAGHGPLTPASIAAAARATDLPDGSLPNGAGLRFSSDPGQLGQNARAAAVIWQWQAAGYQQGGSSGGDTWGTSAGAGSVTDVVIWPGTFSWGEIQMVPLPR